MENKEFIWTSMIWFTNIRSIHLINAHKYKTELVLKSIKKLTEIHSLDIMHTNLAAYAPYITAIITKHPLNNISISYSSLTIYQWITILQAPIHTLRKLSLTYENFTTCQHIHTFTQFLRHQKLIHIQIQFTPLNPQTFGSIITALNTMHTLTTIAFVGCALNKEHNTSIDKLIQHSSISTLNIGSNKLGINMLEHGDTPNQLLNSNLTTLLLANTTLNQICFSLVNKLSKLKCIDLSQNAIQIKSIHQFNKISPSHQIEITLSVNDNDPNIFKDIEKAYNNVTIKWYNNKQ